jgi:ABC-type sugar transport system permease subunit
VGLIFVVGLSNAYGIKPTFLLTSLALVFLLGLNLFFSILYFKQFRLDSAFKHWLQEFGTKAGIIVSFGLLANFRIYRLFFSKWGNRKEFDAVMSDESIFLKSVVFTGVFYFLSGSLPIIVGCIFGVIHIKFGY